MNILICPNAFKGTFKSQEACEVIFNKLKKSFYSAELVSLPLGDGGDGTLDCLIKPLSLIKTSVKVLNPLNELIDSYYGIDVNKKLGVIEMALASGLTLIPYKEGNALYTSSYGTGELIKDALDKGCKKIYIGLGGSGTNDGGSGCLSALGVRFLDAKGNKIVPIGKNLIDIKSIDVSAFDKRVKNCEFVVLSDVTNTLIGASGATRVYGPQKGALGKDNDFLEKGMVSFSKVINKFCLKDISELKGSGAAGGLGGALMGFLNAELKSGSKTILDLCDFDNKLKEADYVITGEGRVDGSSFKGKLVGEILNRCRMFNKRCFVIAGSLGEGYQDIYKYKDAELIREFKEHLDFKYVQENKIRLLEDSTQKIIAYF